MNRSHLRQVLECGSPLPLLHCANVAGNTPRCIGRHPCLSKAAEDCRTPRRWRPIRFMVPMRVRSRRSGLPLFWIARRWPETRHGVLAGTRAFPKRQRTAALQDAGAQSGSWCQCASEVGGRGSPCFGLREGGRKHATVYWQAPVPFQSGRGLPHSKTLAPNPVHGANARPKSEVGAPLVLDCAKVAGNTPRCIGRHPCLSKAAEDCRTPRRWRPIRFMVPMRVRSRRSGLPLFWIARRWPETRHGVLAGTRAFPKRQRTAALQDAGAQYGSWCQCASEVGGRGSPCFGLREGGRKHATVYWQAPVPFQSGRGLPHSKTLAPNTVHGA